MINLLNEPKTAYKFNIEHGIVSEDGNRGYQRVSFDPKAVEALKIFQKYEEMGVYGKIYKLDNQPGSYVFEPTDMTREQMSEICNKGLGETASPQDYKDGQFPAGVRNPIKITPEIIKEHFVDKGAQGYQPQTGQQQTPTSDSVESTQQPYTKTPFSSPQSHNNQTNNNGIISPISYSDNGTPADARIGKIYVKGVNEAIGKYNNGKFDAERLGKAIGACAVAAKNSYDQETSSSRGEQYRDGSSDGKKLLNDTLSQIGIPAVSEAAQSAFNKSHTNNKQASVDRDTSETENPAYAAAASIGQQLRPSIAGQEPYDGSRVSPTPTGAVASLGDGGRGAC
jgi:hypothetical protein